MSLNSPETFLAPRVPQRLALLPCAGVGTRAATAGPKQYQPLCGQPMVVHTLRAMAQVAGLSRTLVVVAKGDGFLLPHLLPGQELADCGGDTRAASVQAGLRHLLATGAHAQDWVLVHDAARCLVTPAQIASLIAACEPDPVGGLLAQPLADTLKQSCGGQRVSATLDRREKWLAQTPQMFRLGALLAALEAAGETVTDEASAMEMAGHAPLLVACSAQNLKVTYPEDFVLAQAILRSRS